MKYLIYLFVTLLFSTTSFASDQNHSITSQNPYQAYEAGQQPGGECNPYVEVKIQQINSSEEMLATLEHKLTGQCNRTVKPYKRQYRLKYKGENCGSITYQGTTIIEGSEITLYVIDNKFRVCSDYRPGILELHEAFPSGLVTSHYVKTHN